MIKQLNTDWISMEDPMNRKYPSLVCSDLEVKLEGSDKVKTWRWKKWCKESWENPTEWTNNFTKTVISWRYKKDNAETWSPE